MRSPRWARLVPFVGASAAAASVVTTIAFARVVSADRKKSVSDCTDFSQDDKGEDAVQFTLKNSCGVPVDCAISWRVVCAPDSKKRRANHPGSVKLALGDHSIQTADASAAMCGDDGFVIDSIRWSCQVNSD